MRIIINADDLGISPEVNRQVFDLMADGKLTSATILANGPAVEEAAREIALFPHCSFGVHLNATQFRPLTRDDRLAPLLDGTRSFGATRIRETLLTPRLLSALAAEWLAQIGRLVSLGVSPTHLDSHNHVHNIPGLFPVLKRVQLKTGIRRVRITRTIFARHERPPSWLLVQKKVWNSALRHVYRTSTTDEFGSLEDFTSHITASDGAGFEGSVVELMVHPGHPDYEPETSCLRNGLSGWLRSQALISYRQLA